MKVQTDAKIDLAHPAHQAYTALLEAAYREFLAQKAGSIVDATGDDGPPKPEKVETAAR